MTETEKLELRYVAVSTLARWDRNPKLHDLGKIAESILRYGFKDPPKYEPTLNDGPVRSRRCPALKTRGIAVLRCLECGYVHRSLTTAHVVDDPPRRSRR